ncbi:MAG: hypothetical protein QOG10_4904 [Kribbellaceae bacterium]|jgi:glucose/arabinose dehydrogenase|nr:hypothetical protein [Kribbellaceae bacterium]
MGFVSILAAPRKRVAVCLIALLSFVMPRAEASGTVLTTTVADVTAPVLQSASAGARVSMSRTLRFSYAYKDNVATVSHDVVFRTAAPGRALGAWLWPAGWQRTKAASVTYTAGWGSDTCFMVRARDGSGNVSAFSAPACSSAPLDDRHLTAAGSVQRLQNAIGFAGTLSRLIRSGSSLSRTGQYGQQVAVVAVAGPGQGAFDVWFAGRWLGRVSLSSTTWARRVYYFPSASAISGTLRIASVTVAPVLVDGATVLRSVPQYPPLVVLPASPAGGQNVRFSGTLPTRVARPLQIQRRTSASAWSTIAATRTNSTGSYAVVLRAPVVVGAYQIRAVVAQATVSGQIFPAYTTPTAALRVVADTQAPTLPRSARTSDLTCNTVTLSWTASSDNVRVAFYDIYHDGQRMPSVSGTTTSTRLTVVPGASWGLYVNARDAAGNVSQASNTVIITAPVCQPDTQPPTAPSALTGSASGTTVTLRWTASTDNIGVAGYDVFRADVRVGSINGSATSFIDSGLAVNTRYEYYVVARDAQGNVSAHSNVVAVTTGAVCGSAVCSVTQVGTDNDIPWGLTTLPDGEVLFSRRDAHDIVRLNPATGAKTTVGLVPNVQSTDGEGGLLGLAIASNFSADPWLYIMHTSPTDNRVVRIRYLAGVLSGSPQVLISGIARNKFHNGGRLRFGPDGKLYVATGDGQNGSWAQDRNNLAGKILRINADGSVPSDNPFGNRVWSYGHRNPQGLAFDSQGRLWQQEFGNSVMDETNIVVKGGNYGWPSCEGTSGTCGTAGFIAPIQTYPTANGSCSGISIVRDVLYIACLRGNRLYRANISGGDLVNVQSLLVGTYGRLRTVEPAPGGGLWLTTSNTGDKDSVPNNSNERIFQVTLG